MLPKASRISRLCAALAVWVALSMTLAPIASADQTDPMLDELFATLQTTSDPAEAAAADRTIWQIWTASGDDAIDRLMQTGLIAMQTGQLAAAEAMFGEIIALRPNFAEGWNKRATVRYLQGDWNGSIADCGQTLALEERHYGALSGLGLIYMAKGDDAVALEWFERALAINPHMAGVRDHITALRKALRGRRI